MSREIKFRAWNLATEEMITNETIFIYADGSIEVGGYTTNDENDSAIVIMQFTGLTDRKGKEIYESDIVQRYSAQTNGARLSKHGIRVIKWRADSINIVGWNIGRGRRPNTGDNLRYIEVVGNIYENPELLEGVQS